MLTQVAYRMFLMAQTTFYQHN